MNAIVASQTTSQLGSNALPRLLAVRPRILVYFYPFSPNLYTSVLEHAIIASISFLHSTFWPVRACFLQACIHIGESVGIDELVCGGIPIYYMLDLIGASIVF